MNKKLGNIFNSQLMYSIAKSKVAENLVLAENWRVYPMPNTIAHNFLCQLEDTQISLFSKIISRHVEAYFYKYENCQNGGEKIFAHMFHV